MGRVVVALALLVFVVWGVRTSPGRPFSWAMFSASSKPFLWIDDGREPRVARFDELRLAPDSHYLVPSDLPHLVEESNPPAPIRGLIVGTRGSWSVEFDGPDAGLRCTEVRPGEDLAQLALALRRLGCRPR
jgi:hypothetical protein